MVEIRQRESNPEWRAGRRPIRQPGGLLNGISAVRSQSGGRSVTRRVMRRDSHHLAQVGRDPGEGLSMRISVTASSHTP